MKKYFYSYGKVSASKMVIVYEDIDVSGASGPVSSLEIEDELIVPVRAPKKCVIPCCKNVGRGKYIFCNKHKKMYRFEKPEECAICMDDMKNEKYPLRGEVEGKCGHWIHHSCVVSSGKQECPICREKVKLNKEQQKQLLEIQKKNKKEKEQEERREIMQALQVERTLITRNTRWMDERGSISDFFTHRSRNVVGRVQEYLDSDERTATILQLQDTMTSTSQSIRNNSTVLFELQNSFATIMNTGLSVDIRTHNLFYRIIGAIEYEIRSQVIENLD